MADGVKDRRETTTVWFFVVLLQVALGWLLLRIPAPLAILGQDEALVVEFIARPRAMNVPLPTSRPARMPARGRLTDAMAARPVGATANMPDAPASSGAEDNAAVPPLDLRLPTVPSVRRNNAFERSPPIEARSTRFARAWLPEGDALRQASFRSAVVAGALGAFGGPPRHCSEVERRLRGSNCLPLHGQDEEDEALRRSLDR